VLSINAKSPVLSILLDIITLMRSLQVSGCVVRSIQYLCIMLDAIYVFQVSSDLSLSDSEYWKDDEMKEDVSGTEI
jgi:hypothetical protein